MNQVDNFIKNYSKDGLKKICTMFCNKISNEIIAQEFGVTRQRVHQWQKLFVKKVVVLKSGVTDVLTDQEILKIITPVRKS